MTEREWERKRRRDDQDEPVLSVLLSFVVVALLYTLFLHVLLAAR